MTIPVLRAKALPTSIITILVLSVTLIGATFVAAAPPSVAVNLDQCRNGKLTSPQTSVTQCTGSGSGNSGWVNGNAGAANAHFAEGESISYRARLTNLTVGDQVKLIMAYDVIHSGKQAIDYLTDKNRWQLPETTVAANPDDPCSTICDPATLVPTSTIPIDPPETNIQVDTTKTLADGCQTPGGGATQQPLTSFTAVANAGQAEMELFGGINGSFAYVGPDPDLLDRNGNQQQQIEVTFEATSSNPVLAWGGHIASRLDWGCLGAPQSASGISGSPYHMAINSAIVNGTPVNLGNQDRSLSASAVIFVAPTLTTTPGGSATYSATVTDSLNVGVSNAGGTADFYLFTSPTECGEGATGDWVYRQLAVPVVNGTTAGTAVSTTFTGLTAAVTYYWFVHYSGDNSANPAVGAGDSVCTESVAFTPPGVTPAGS